jgi:hypothetical protein
MSDSRSSHGPRCPTRTQARTGRSARRLMSHIGGPLTVAMRQPCADDPTTGTGTKKPTEILGGLLSSCQTRFGRADRI